ncbi:MAG: hypothetical protein EXS06_09210 [Planctomycetaceae bacterium]|nr:hypothetical protein [Planctomycetaceae bacterium]
MTPKPDCCDVVREPVAVAPCRPGGPAPRRLAASISGMLLACLPLLPAFPQEPEGGRATPQPQNATSGEDPAALAAREQQLLAQYRELEKTFLRLADLLAASDPRRAAVLRSVFEQARDQEVGGRLDTIVQLLEKGQLLKAGTTQASAIEQLRELLTLLEAGDSDRHLANSKEEVKQFLARVSKLIAKQRDIEGSTEAGAREAQLLDRQNALAGETSDLSRELGGFAKRMEVRDAGGEPVKVGKEPKDGPNGDPAEGDEPGAPKGGKQSPQEGQPGGEKPAGKSGDQPSEADGGKPGEGEPQPGEGEPAGDEKPASEEGEKGGSTKPSQGGEPAGGEGSGDSPQEPNEPGQQPEGDDESSRAKRTQNRLEAAAERMRRAEEGIEKAKRRDARQEQEKAIEELETARAELEEILRQMREQEVERLLVQLETRLRAMLRAEKAVLAAAEKIAAEPTAGRERERELEAARLGREQTAIGAEAAKALTLVRDDGSAVAIPEALEQVRDDATQAAARLGRGDVGGTTRGIVQDIVSSLEEMVAALEKAQREEQQQQKGSAGGRPAEPGEQPLVDKLSELKMIRSLQMRVNTRTRRFSQVLGEGAEQAEEPELLDAVRRLSDRQRKIERAAHDIVTGLTE